MRGRLESFRFLPHSASSLEVDRPKVCLACFQCASIHWVLSIIKRPHYNPRGSSGYDIWRHSRENAAHQTPQSVGWEAVTVAVAFLSHASLFTQVFILYEWLHEQVADFDIDFPPSSGTTSHDMILQEAD